MAYFLKRIAAIGAACLLAACGISPSPLHTQSAALPPTPTSQPPAPPIASLPTPTASPRPQAPADDETGNPYIRQLADDLLAELKLEGMNDYSQVQAAYEALIERTYFAPPLGLDSWQLHPGAPPDYIENRALSPLAYGVGSCEDYACAMVILLRRMGFSARYLPGITISVQGDFVDHAWAAVALDGEWYHLDPQLEDNIMKNDLLRYRYFLKTDQEMLVDHRWGQNLLDYAQLTDTQRREVEQEYLLPPCLSQYPTPPPRQLHSPPPPNLGALIAEIAAQRAIYEAEQGKLPGVTLHVTPPVFGLAGYGPPD